MAGFKRQALAEADAARPVITLGDLAGAGIDVFCWCNRCGHHGEVGIGLLRKQLGPAQAVPDIGMHLRCTGCGSKDVACRPSWPALPGRPLS